MTVKMQIGTLRGALELVAASGTEEAVIRVGGGKDAAIIRVANGERSLEVRLYAVSEGDGLGGKEVSVQHEALMKLLRVAGRSEGKDFCTLALDPKAKKLTLKVTIGSDTLAFHPPIVSEKVAHPILDEGRDYDVAGEASYSSPAAVRALSDALQFVVRAAGKDAGCDQVLLHGSRLVASDGCRIFIADGKALKLPALDVDDPSKAFGIHRDAAAVLAQALKVDAGGDIIHEGCATVFADGERRIFQYGGTVKPLEGKDESAGLDFNLQAIATPGSQIPFAALAQDGKRLRYETLLSSEGKAPPVTATVGVTTLRELLKQAVDKVVRLTLDGKCLAIFSRGEKDTRQSEMPVVPKTATAPMAYAWVQAATLGSIALDLGSKGGEVVIALRPGAPDAALGFRSAGSPGLLALLTPEAPAFYDEREAKAAGIPAGAAVVAAPAKQMPQIEPGPAKQEAPPAATLTEKPAKKKSSKRAPKKAADAQGAK